MLGNLLITQTKTKCDITHRLGTTALKEGLLYYLCIERAIDFIYVSPLVIIKSH